MRGRLAAAVAALAVATATLAGCSGGDGRSLPAPTSSSTTTSTAPVDYTRVSLVGVDPGKPPPATKPPGRGEASMAGRVVDGNGVPVPNAIVRATYYGVPDKPEVIEALAGPDGRYRFDQVFGGRWRIRAWLVPTMATLEVPSFFLGAREQKVLDLKVRAVPDVAVTVNFAPDTPLMYSPVQLAVLVVTQTVDPEGRVSRSVAAGTPISLTLSSEWALQSENGQATDASGTARWTLVCLAEAPQPVTAVAMGREFPISSPSCIDPASTTTTTVAPPAAAGEQPATSSTRPRPRTTTTTRPKGPTSSTRPPVQPR